MKSGKKRSKEEKKEEEEKKNRREREEGEHMKRWKCNKKGGIRGVGVGGGEG